MNMPAKRQTERRRGKGGKLRVTEKPIKTWKGVTSPLDKGMQIGGTTLDSLIGKTEQD